jgi:hypothetical protein
MASMKTKTFILFWKTWDRWQIVRGVDIAGAANNAGIGGGAIGALDYYQDITAFANSKTMRNLFRDIDKHHTYWWRPKHVAKAKSFFQIKEDQPFVDLKIDSRPGVTGVELTDFGKFLYTKLFKE